LLDYQIYPCTRNFALSNSELNQSLNRWINCCLVEVAHRYAKTNKMADSLEKLFVTREKDFIKQNILHTKRSYPAEPKQRSVDTRYGDTHDLKRSGLLPIYVHKKVWVSRVRSKILLLLAFNFSCYFSPLWIIIFSF